MYINEHGKEVWKGVDESSPFSSELFHTVTDMGDYSQLQAFNSNLGSITVLDRLTGFGWRDIETGYRSPDGKFWLASGGCDVLASFVSTVGDAIEWIKSCANTCNPDRVDEE